MKRKGERSSPPKTHAEEADFFPDLPRQVVRVLLKTFAETVGSQPDITSTVEEITGRPARTFPEWAEDHREDFAG